MNNPTPIAVDFQPHPLTQFCFTSDGDGHWFFIPYHKMDEWEKFLANPEMPYMELPEWAQEAEDPEHYVFTSLPQLQSNFHS